MRILNGIVLFFLNLHYVLDVGVRLENLFTGPIILFVVFFTQRRSLYTHYNKHNLFKLLHSLVG